MVIHPREHILRRNTIQAYWSKSKNMDNLNYFVYNKWINDMSSKLAGGQALFLSGGFENHQRLVEITNNCAHDVDSLFSTLEEADTCCCYMSMTLRGDMGLELPLFGHQILMCWSCAWHFRRRLI